MKKYLKNILLYFDRSFSKGTMKQTLWLLGIMVVVYMFLIALSYLKNLYTQGGEGSNGRWYDVIFTLIDPGSGTRSMFPAFTILCALFGLVLFSGMLISVISNVLERRVDSYVKGETTYNLSNHVVVLGYSKSLISLLRSINRSYRDSYILIMSERSSEELRDWIHSNVSEEEEIEKRVVVMNGVRNTADDIKRLKLDKNVKEIYILGEENERAHDSLNMDCLKKIAKELNGDKLRIKCHVLLNSPTMFDILQTVDIDEDIKERIDFMPFNFNEIWAQKALATMPSDNVDVNGVKVSYKPLDDSGITVNSSKHVHLVVVGMTEMGQSVATNAAHILHFPNFKEGDFDTYSHITFIDDNAKLKGRDFRSSYRALFNLARWRSMYSYQASRDDGWRDPIGDANSQSPYRGESALGTINFIDQQWEFIEGSMTDYDLMKYLERCAKNENEILTIAFCHEESERNVHECLMLTEVVIAGACQVLVRQRESAFMIDMLCKRPDYKKIKPFGIESECFYNDEIHAEMGKLVNAAYEKKIDLNDTHSVQNKWHEKSVADKWSSMFSANMLFTKLRSIGLVSASLSLKDIEKAVKDHEKEMQRTEHNRWNTEKLLLGFSPLSIDYKDWKIGKAKFQNQMLHFSIRSFEKLPDEEKEKDIKINSKLHLLYTKYIEYIESLR